MRQDRVTPELDGPKRSRLLRSLASKRLLILGLMLLAMPGLSRAEETPPGKNVLSLYSFSRRDTFDSLEHLKSVIRGHTAGAVNETRIDDLLGRGLVIFCTFITLFGFREVSRVLGEEKFQAMLFGSGGADGNN